MARCMAAMTAGGADVAAADIVEAADAVAALAVCALAVCAPAVAALRTAVPGRSVSLGLVVRALAIRNPRHRRTPGMRVAPDRVAKTTRYVCTSHPDY